MENGLRLWNNGVVKKYFRRRNVFILLSLSFLTWFYFCLPRQLFTHPTSTVVFSHEGELLGAKIAPDGQWRFPESEVVSPKFIKAIVLYEDEYFFKHIGVNPFSIVKAIKQNVKAGEIKRGGSTITQQTIRLSRNNPPRTYWEKGKELIYALRLELRYSKKKILSLYSSHAPFGGNVVGLDAAAWRYFGRNANELSWAEAATLAVLPNSPGLIHPGRNRNDLKQKRNALLQKLYTKQIIDEITFQNALLEELPLKPVALPQKAPHLLERANAEFKGQIVESSIYDSWQNATNQIINTHYSVLKQNKVHNAAAIIIDINTKQVRAYVGNTPTTAENQNQVDMVTAARSTGSLLKPFLYAGSLDGGEILPESLLPDIPSYYSSYSPKNFDKTYSGAVRASVSLTRSLNVPAVKLLYKYGIPRFHHQLQQLKLRHVSFKPSHYGLPLILGGAESSLWDLSKAYAGMASTLNHYTLSNNEYYNDEYSSLSIRKKDSTLRLVKRKQYEVFSAASIWQTFETLTEVKRPNTDNTWEYFMGNQKVAWKTGTSYGNKDAWAIGVTPDYVVGVWVGNADGEGRAGTTGLGTAAPILFDIVELLPTSKWFTMPVEELYSVEVCTLSGELASPNCTKTKEQWICENGLHTPPCQYHKVIHTTKDVQFQVKLDCEPAENVVKQTWFVLPPSMEMFYANSHPTYKRLPPFKPGCGQNKSTISILYPQYGAKVSIPKNLGGKEERMIAKVAHKNPESKLYWYVDDEFIGETTEIHELAIQPTPGRHLLNVTDQSGEQVFRYFTVE